MSSKRTQYLSSTLGTNVTVQYICVGSRCECRSGYQILPDGITCGDLNECSKNNGGCSNQCQNTEVHFNFKISNLSDIIPFTHPRTNKFKYAKDCHHPSFTPECSFPMAICRCECF